ncbi:MAG: serine/threonine-protein phosphatase, partial [Thermoflexales bacterium]|nr:serine/threonine-protein phosphatase [Thermoflexales bacterium]
MREENQDAFWLPDTASSNEEAVFVVADGMGGGQLGGLAARNAIDAILSVLRTSHLTAQTHSLADRVREAVVYANKVVHAMQGNVSSHDPITAQVGCALAIGILRKRTLTIAHVGDVRVYLWRRGELRALTRDHSWAYEFSEGDQESQAMRHVLSRAIGPKPEVEPDICLQPLEPGDRVVFCTDGVWAALSETQMAHLIAHTAPALLASRLVRAAQSQDDSDNATALAIVFGKGSCSAKKLLTPVGLVLLALLGLGA